MDLLCAASSSSSSSAFELYFGRLACMSSLLSSLKDKAGLKRVSKVDRGVKEEELRASLHLEDIEVDWHLRVDIGKGGGRGRRVTNEMM